VTARVRARVEGQVQGVGFRPAVYRHAVSQGLTGFVRNDPQGVTLEVEGEEGAIAEFFAGLQSASPRQSNIVKVTRRRLPPRGDQRFEVAESDSTGEVAVRFPPDLATCGACLAEMDDPNDRRYRYPFTNCVDCGPRFTIVEGLPYDRPNTSMKSFTMGTACAAEDHDPADRRFHAQPVACPDCGPHLFLLDKDGTRRDEGEEALAATQAILAAGGVVAVKGLGGYHLACDAFDEAAVTRLRDRKRRPHQSVAVMFRDLDVLRTHLALTADEEAELQSSARPIVVVRGRLGPGIAPDTATTGVFLPYTPLHHLLMEPFEALVLTSGNHRDEPLAKDETEILALLGSFADAALAHDRPIVRRCDDSVVQIVGGERRFLRRSRGFVPEPVRIAAESEAILATGGEMKATFCVVVRGEAYVSQHIGELRDFSAFTYYRDEIERWENELRVHPLVVAHDLHPSYLSTGYAEERVAAVLIGVQHHHAHIAGVMAEHGLHSPVLGVALDGTGFGPDGTVWGGEILLADRAGFERLAHFKTYALPGGDRAIEEPWRMALSVALTEDLAWRPSEPGTGVGAADIERLLASGTNCPPTSSAGRLFDAVAAMLDLCTVCDYEAQAAIRLEATADGDEAGVYPYVVHRDVVPWVLDFGPALRQLLEDKGAGIGTATIAARFHHTVAAAVTEVCADLSTMRGVREAALSGGVFQNRLVLKSLTQRLEEAGLRVYANCLVPANDGGVSLGQAAVAIARMAGGDPECV
jgi:hydrogenase maturation protein HypF